MTDPRLSAVGRYLAENLNSHSGRIPIELLALADAVDPMRDKQRNATKEIPLIKRMREDLDTLERGVQLRDEEILMLRRALQGVVDFAKDFLSKEQVGSAIPLIAAGIALEWKP